MTNVTLSCEEHIKKVQNLMQHQSEAIEFLQGKQGAALFYEMGLGKTRIMLHALSEKTASNYPILVVCPLSAVSVWQKDSEKFNYGFKFAELVGSRQKRIDLLNETWPDIFVINYDGLRMIPNQLKAKGFKTIVFDESHRIKERASQQTRIALELCEKIPNRYIMSGTPVAKSPEDIWTQFQAIAPGLLGNYYAFRNRYIDYKSQKIWVHGALREIRKPIRFKNLKELEARTSPISLRRTKAECLDLPEKIYHVRNYNFSDEQRKHYLTLKTSLATIVDDKQFNVHTASALMQKLSQICQGFIYKDTNTGDASFFPSGKVSALKEILEDIPNENVIIFTWFKADIERLRKEIGETHDVLVYEGSSEERNGIATSFQMVGDKSKVFLANIEKAKEALTLTSASTVIYFGNSWSHASRVQSEDRAHRIGQTKNVNYFDILCKGAVDDYVYQVLKRKGKLADSVTGDSLRMAKLILGREDL